MRELTVNQARVRLGDLMKRVMIGRFPEEYHAAALQVDESQSADIMAAHRSSAEDYLKIIASFLHQPEKVMQINNFTHPLVIYAIGLRYHLVTQLLAEWGQNGELLVPEPDTKFLQFMLLQLLEKESISNFSGTPY